MKENQKNEHSNSKIVKDLFLEIREIFLPVSLSLNDFKTILAITLTRFALNYLTEERLEILFRYLKNKYSFIDKKTFFTLIEHLIEFRLIRSNRITEQGIKILEILSLD